MILLGWRGAYYVNQSPDQRRDRGAQLNAGGARAGLRAKICPDVVDWRGGGAAGRVSARHRWIFGHVRRAGGLRQWHRPSRPVAAA